MAKTLHHPLPTIGVHMARWLVQFDAGRLEQADEEAVETHLWTCDDCFAAYVALHLRRD